MALEKVTYRNHIEACMGILPADIEDMRRKTPKRMRPESKRRAAKRAHESRRRNR